MTFRAAFGSVVAMLVVLAHVCTVAVHEVGDSMDPGREGSYSANTMDGPDGHPQRGAPTERHCHGCFSSAISMVMQIGSSVGLGALLTWPRHDTAARGDTVPVDPPPPRRT